MIEKLDVPLEIFIIVNLINDFILLIDYCLILTGQTSITAIAKQYPFVGLICVIFEMVAPVCMYLHFKQS